MSNYKKSNPIKVLYLYRELMPYNIEVLRSLVRKNCHVTVVHDDKNKLTPYIPPEIENISFYKKSELTYSFLKKLAIDFQPDIVYVSDRTIALYNKVAILLRNQYKTPVISGNDTPWNGGKQWFNVLTSFFRHKRFFSHMLVAGMRQFEYAKKLGFKNDKILFPLYSANTNLFFNLEITSKRFLSRDILFVGRFHKVKGLDLLINAWKNVEDKKGARLILVGNGDFLKSFELPDDVLIKGFSSQEDLLRIAENCRAFIIPSRFEPWGLVIHEFAAAGLPIIATNICGAVPHFVINNYNGLVIKPDSSQEIKNAIKTIMAMDEYVLLNWGEKSRELSKSINPEMVSAAILSVL